MKFWLGTLSLIALFITSITILYNVKSPEQNIIGKWEEVSWEFERIDTDTTQQQTNFAALQRDEIYKNLIIHNAEVWEFKPEKELILNSKDSLNATNLNWAIKGRGHILELKYNNLKSETYQVHSLTKDKMEVYFNFDLQIRGIVKMTFKKIETPKNYAKKI